MSASHRFVVGRRIRRAWRAAPLGCLLTAVAAPLGCVDSTGPPHPLLEEIDFAPELGVDLARMTRIGGGVYIWDTVPGTGADLDVRQTVRIDYQLFLPDGRHVQTRGDVRFVTGCRQVVEGLEAGIHGMRVGGKRLVVVPPRMGYGANPPWLVDIPPHAPLVFFVDAIDTRPASDRPCGVGS